MTPLPNFFVVGAAKSGTTALERYLSAHPQIYMSPIKEPSYFARDIIPQLPLSGWQTNQQGLEAYLDGPMRERRGGCVLEWEQYLKLFRHVQLETAIGEASTAYLISPAAPAEIRSRIPGARIVIMLRSPVERVFSTWVMFRRNGKLPLGFSDFLRSSEGDTSRWRHTILETRKIAEGVERFMAAFPAQAVRWYFHEDFSAAPLRLMRDIYSFLGVDPAFEPDVTRRHNESILPRGAILHRALRASGVWGAAHRVMPAPWRRVARRALFRAGKIEITPADRSLLIDYFRDDVRRLQRLVGRDLSHWLRPE
jgi:hypothetical protein